MHFWNEIRRSNENIERICFKTHINTNTLYRNVIEDIESAQCVAGVAFMWHWNKSTCNRWSNKQINSKAKSQKMTINFRKRKWTTERHIKSDKPNAKLNICKSKQINIHRQQIQAASCESTVIEYQVSEEWMYFLSSFNNNFLRFVHLRMLRSIFLMD